MYYRKNRTLGFVFIVATIIINNNIRWWVVLYENNDEDIDDGWNTLFVMISQFLQSIERRRCSPFLVVIVTLITWVKIRFDRDPKSPQGKVVTFCFELWGRSRLRNWSFREIEVLSRLPAILQSNTFQEACGSQHKLSNNPDRTLGFFRCFAVVSGWVFH